MSDPTPAPADRDSATENPGAASASAFGLLCPGVQKALWKMGWKSLRPLQVTAIRTILGSEDHVVL